MQERDPSPRTGVSPSWTDLSFLTFDQYLRAPLTLYVADNVVAVDCCYLANMELTLYGDGADDGTLHCTRENAIMTDGFKFLSEIRPYVCFLEATP